MPANASRVAGGFGEVAGWCNLKTAAQLSGFSHECIKLWCVKGEVDAIRSGGRWHVRIRSVFRGGEAPELIDNKLLLGAVAAFVDFGQGKAERQARTVIEPLAGVLLHGAQNVLAVFTALIFVKQGDDLPAS
jgi:hypothetical protein